MTSLLLPTLLLAATSTFHVPQSTHAKAQRGLTSHGIHLQKKKATLAKSAQGRRNPKVIVASIEKAVREEFSTPSNRERLETWDFHVDKDYKSLTVSSVGAPIYLDPSDPHQLPFNAQYNVEYLNKFFLGSNIPARLWRPRLNALRNAIYQTVVVIESTRDREKLLKNLEPKAKSLDGLLKGLKDFIIDFYKAKGYEIFMSGAMAMVLPVPVATEPAGGTVKVMKYLNYRKCLVFGIQKSLWPWLTINQQQAPLLGRYRYQISWPDGRTAEGDIRIVSVSPVVFRPTH